MYQIVQKLNGRDYPVTAKFDNLEDAQEELIWWRDTYPADRYAIVCFCI